MADGEPARKRIRIIHPAGRPPKEFSIWNSSDSSDWGSDWENDPGYEVTKAQNRRVKEMLDFTEQEQARTGKTVTADTMMEVFHNNDPRTLAYEARLAAQDAEAKAAAENGTAGKTTAEQVGTEVEAKAAVVAVDAAVAKAVADSMVRSIGDRNGTETATTTSSSSNSVVPNSSATATFSRAQLTQSATFTLVFGQGPVALPIRSEDGGFSVPDENEGEIENSQGGNANSTHQQGQLQLRRGPNEVDILGMSMITAVKT